jgi:ADP-heptose:LPS heptosyltransferase
MATLGYGDADRFAAVLPGGSWESKRWSVAGFVEAGRAAADRLGSPTLVVWGPPEVEEARAIADGLGSAGRLAPPSRLRQMAALLGRPTVLLSTDCLARHFSVVQGVPTIGVFGTTDARDWTPPHGPHRAVQAPPGASLRQFPSAPVVQALDALLAEVDSGAARL